MSSLKSAEKRCPTDEKVPLAVLVCALVCFGKLRCTNGRVLDDSQWAKCSVSLFDCRNDDPVYMTSPAKCRTRNPVEASREHDFESFGTLKNKESSCF
mmetsp:Transcript_5149/g.13160  ORF Transcript_5149/g.13160 Transcript_5149/m.13160 type:complete len:98 (+) Transcript_5149:41-334(+)